MPECDSLSITPQVGDSESSINLIEKRKHNILINGRTVIINNVENGKDICLFNLNGLCLYKKKQNGTSSQISIPSSGVFMIKIGGDFQKIVIN